MNEQKIMDKEEMISLLKDIMETAQQCGRPNTPDVGEWYTVFSTARIIRDELKNEGMFNTINVENCIFTFARQIFKRLSEEEKKKILNSSVLSHKTLLFSDFEEYVRTILCSNFEYDFGFSLLDLEEEK